MSDSDSLQEHDADWAASTHRLDRYLRTLPHETTEDAELANRADSMTIAPWSEDYENGGSGPALLIAHGSPEWLKTEVRAGAVIWDGNFSVRARTMDGYLNGVATWRQLRTVRYFQDHLTRNAGASVLGIVCHVAEADWSDEFMEAMRRDGFTNKGHFGVDKVATPMIANGTFVSTDNNGGFNTYLRPSPDGRTRRIVSPGTMYTEDEIRDIARRERRRRGR